MGRTPCCDKHNVKRGPWSPDEDAALKTYLEAHGTGGNWILLPKKAGLKRCGKSCRLRWLNYLRPDIKHGGFTEKEDHIICNLFNQMGSRWSAIAAQLPGRTDNDVKNYWNTKLKKKLFGVGGNKLTFTAKITKEPSDNASVSLLPFAPNIEPKDSAFTTFQTQFPPTLQMINDVNNSGINYNQTMSLVNPDEFYNSKLTGFSDFGASAKKSYSGAVTLSQDGSTVSDSSSIAAVDKCASLPSNGVLDEYMEFGFGQPYDTGNYGMLFGEKTSEVYPNCYQSVGDFFASQLIWEEKQKEMGGGSK